MSFLHKQFIQVFTEIEQNYSTLFTEDDHASLAELRKNLPEQQSLEQQSDALARWCKERPQICKEIQNALLKLQNNSDSGTRGPGGHEPKEYTDYKWLNNIVRPSESSSQDELSSQSEPSSQNKLSSQSEPPSQS